MMSTDIPLPPMPPMPVCLLPPAKPGVPACAAPWNHVQFEPVVERETTAKHCFSVCLYHEPLYAKRYPQRDFAGRYLAAMPAVKVALEQHGWHLKIFADEPMVSTALALDCGDVYVVRGRPAFPFAQHLYRYYAALLPEHPTIKAYHFRGLDNVGLNEAELRVADLLIREGLDVEHRPYMRMHFEGAGKHRYFPVRGSCAVANEGIKSLAWWLRTQPLKCPTDPWPALFHCDEAWLKRWFEACRQHLRLLTVTDHGLESRRGVPWEFHTLLQQLVEHQQSYLMTSLC